MRGGRRAAFFTACLIAILALLRLELNARPSGLAAVPGTSDALPSPFATVLPCTVKDAQWLVAKIMSCARTLSDQNTRVVLVMLPRRDVQPMQAALREASTELPAHWHLVPEDEVLPRLTEDAPYRPRIPGWNLQQALKLLARHHPLVALASPPIEYIMTIDSDVVCALDWDHGAADPPAPAPALARVDARSAQVLGGGDAFGGLLSPSRRESAFAQAFLLPNGRIVTCVERLSGWYGQRHLLMTALSFNFTEWLSEERRVPKQFQGAHVMGWTPQIISVRALDRVEAELARRVPAPSEPRSEPPSTATFRRLAGSTMWTEYFTYFLALDALGLWSTYHESMCAEHGSRIEPASGRCVAELAPLGAPDDPDAIVAALARINTTRSSAVPGCLKVRVDCVQELVLELGHAVVPFLTVNDHKLGAEQVVRAVRATLRDPHRHARHETLKAAATRCCAAHRLLWRKVAGLVYRPSWRIVDTSCAR